MRHTWLGCAVIVGLLVLSESSQAQMPGPYQPPISPYINILRGGAPAAVNYFNIVQPQLEFNAAISQLQTQQSIQGQAIAAGSTLGLTTGHPVMFGNYSHYYPTGRMGFGGVGGTALGTSGLGGAGGYRMGGYSMGGMGASGMGMSGMGMSGIGGFGMGGMGNIGMSGMGMGGMMGRGGMGIPGGR